jgi:hypothetical protein
MSVSHNYITALLLKAAMIAALWSLSSCGGMISQDKPLRREKISDGTSRRILVEDQFVWTQSFARISASTPDGDQRFKVQVRSKQDSILWAAISDDMIGLRVGKAIVIGDSAAFTSTLLGIDWTGSAEDLAEVTGVEVPFLYLNRLMRGQLIEAEPIMRYKFDGRSDLWKTEYAISRHRRVEVALDRDLHTRFMVIEDPKERVKIDYLKVDERTGYPVEMELTLDSRPEYHVRIEVQEIRTEGPYKTPFSF